MSGIRTSLRRVLRLMRENDLLAPGRVGKPRGPRNHDGTIIPDTVDTMWGTDMTTTWTAEGQAAVFVAVDHNNAGCVGIHAARRGTRFEALEPMRQGMRRHFGGIGKDVAHGLAIRHDHGSHVWTARGFKMGYGESAAVRLRSCVRPTDAASWPLAQMGSANDIRTIHRHGTAGDPCGILSFVGSTDRHPLQTRLNPWRRCEAQAALG